MLRNIFAALCVATAAALAPPRAHGGAKGAARKTRCVAETRASVPGALMVALATLPASALPAAAAGPLDQLPAALAAYGHYLGLVVAVGAIVTERVLVKPGMTESEFDTVAKADIVYGVSGALLLGTGYLRAVEFGKGWEFYAHEPVFWVKLGLFSVVVGASLFPTVSILRHSLTQKAAKERGGAFEPPSQKLVKRMTSVINAQLLALGAIPLAASLMARGFGHVGDFPWQVGAAPVALTAVAAGAKYVKEALDWQEDGQEVL